MYMHKAIPARDNWRLFYPLLMGMSV